MLKRLIELPVLLLIRSYQYLVSPFLPASCRYYPTCSAYAHEAIQTHGIVAGLWLAVKRISSCHPWSAGGYDPVPPKHSKCKHSCSHQHIK